MQNEASFSQREAADPNATVWVCASAGSGKTKVLVDRILRLLLNGVDVQKILCITFTQAAAAQMKERLRTIALSWATCSDEELIQALRILNDTQYCPEHLETARLLSTYLERTR